MCRWADLPKELLEMISKRLDFRVDVLRFRSVCTSWRCSVSPPSFDQEIPPVFLKLPHPICADAVLMQTAICRMEYPRNYPSSSCSLSKSSLVKVGESKACEACLLKLPSGISVFGINKVAMFPLSASCNNNCELGILAIYHEGKLGYWKNGDKEWTLLDDRNFEYDDITVYRGQFYVVDRRGTVSWIDPSLKVIQYSPPLHGCGGQKNLVESCGDLYVVDRYLDGERRTWRDYEDAMGGNDNSLRLSKLMRKPGPVAVDFRVYKLDEEWEILMEAKGIAFTSCMIVCVSVMEWGGGAIHVFRFEDHSIDNLTENPGFSEIFWPSNVGSST
ncbi:F-BOX PROTEIN SKIP23 [Salix viminalis]|uniref:F-BOX PROTEIN SKIP23 n=1 Tax=Salix viminalis TaxID=40686 RepID=A0A9Q0ZJS3_SALVM|nr:F-BOX PROTEIN SKIP23 [Salix viminalis]